MRFDEPRLWSEMAALRQRYAERDARVALRNLLAFRRKGDDIASGTFLPPPFDKSQLILKFRTPEITDAAIRLQADVTANPPIAQVRAIVSAPAALSDADEEGRAMLELFLNETWAQADRRSHLQEQAAWSQITEGDGWYLAQPAGTAFGLPDRAYFEDLTDDQIEALQDEGRLTVLDREGKSAYAESADSWASRRADALRVKALNGQALFHLEFLSAAMVYPEFDAHGLRAVLIVQRVTDSEFHAGSPLMQDAARFAHVSPKDVQDYRLWIDRDGKVAGGLPAGEADESRSGAAAGWLYWRYFSRDEYYCYASGPAGGGGHLVLAGEHSMRRVPLFWVPGVLTSASAGEERALPALDGMIALAPLVNQLATLLSNVATKDATDRYYIQMKDGAIKMDPDAPDKMMVVDHQKTIGLDPRELEIIYGGELKKVPSGDPNAILQMLQFAYQRLSLSLPSEAEVGGGSLQGPAFGRQQAMAASGKRAGLLVRHHKAAMLDLFTFLTDMLRQLDTPVYLLAPPGHRGSAKTARGLIEVDPRKIVPSLDVQQDTFTPEQQIINTQVAVELRNQGVITDLEMYERMGKDDPHAARRAALVQKIGDIILYGSTQGVDPNSLVARVIRLVEGQLVDELLTRSPRLAMALAEAQAAEPTAPAQRMGGARTTGSNGLGGPVNEAAGVVAPGVGMAVTTPRTGPGNGALVGAP